MHEFDSHIIDYRKNNDKVLALSGESSEFFAQFKAEKLRSWLPQLAQKQIDILDFGCGDGVMTQYVAQCFPLATLYGIDPSAESIQVAQSKFPSLNFSSFQENGSLPYADHSFDIIYAAGVFHHIPFEHHEFYKNALMNMLKPHGHLVIFELNPLNPLTVKTFKSNPIDHHAKMLSPWYGKALLPQSSIKFYCFFPRLVRFLRPLEPYMTKIPLGAHYALIYNRAD